MDSTFDRRKVLNVDWTDVAPEDIPATILAGETRLSHTNILNHPPGWQSDSVLLDGHLFVLVERGTLRARIGDENVQLPAGAICWLPPGALRKLSVAFATPVQTWRLRFQLFLDGKAVGLNCPPIIRCDASSLLSHQQLLSEIHGNPRYEAEVGPVLSAFVSRFLTLPELSEMPSRRLDGAQRRRVERLVKRGLLSGITPADMAAEAGLSSDYFTRLFKASYGMPPRTYLLQKRMELAGDILRDSAMSVKEVCAELGETDVGTFCRLFKRVMGKTPSQFRKASV